MMNAASKMVTVAAVLLVAAGAFAVGRGLLADGDGSDRQEVVLAGSSVADEIVTAEEQATAQPNDAGLKVGLGNLYLLEARETGDPTAYARAEASFNEAIALRPGDADALIGLSAVASGRHEFENALAFARQAPADDADTQAVLGDALLELGRYEEAFAAYEAASGLRPDTASYTRIAYARELSGDVEGAIEAMTLAADAAGTAGESAAWTRLQLGHLYFNKGDLGGAGDEYARSLEALNGYPHAIAGLARIAAAEGDFGEAASMYEDVIEREPILEYVIALGDIYQAAGRSNDATRQFALVDAIRQLYEANGVTTDVELAIFRADHGSAAEAVELARTGYESRPGIHAADALAWALHRAGSNEEALRYSREALRLGTRDATMLFHAGMIAAANGDNAEARRLLGEALDANPNFSVLHAEDAQATLDRLESAVTR